MSIILAKCKGKEIRVLCIMSSLLYNWHSLFLFSESVDLFLTFMILWIAQVLFLIYSSVTGKPGPLKTHIHTHTQQSWFPVLMKEVSVPSLCIKKNAKFHGIVKLIYQHEFRLHVIYLCLLILSHFLHTSAIWCGEEEKSR